MQPSETKIVPSRVNSDVQYELAFGRVDVLIDGCFVARIFCHVTKHSDSVIAILERITQRHDLTSEYDAWLRQINGMNR
jgi:hypothetical protein